eukprot:g608.t1
MLRDGPGMTSAAAMKDGDLFGGDDDRSSAGEEEWGGDDWQADVSTVLAAAGGQAEAASAPAPTTELARQESAEAGRALFVRAVSEEEDSESKGEGAAGGAAGGLSAGPRKTAPVDERVLLRGIYEALGGPEHWSRKWDLDQPVNTLHGVTCDERGRVVKIDLPRNGVRGDLSEVQWPVALQELDLAHCQRIKGDLSKVQWPAGLQRLDLRLTTVSGDLSQVKWPASLKTLNLSGNMFHTMQITGDLSKVQWPAALQSLNLMGCKKVQSDLSKVQWPAGLQRLDLRLTTVSGDLSKVQWPAALKKLDLSYCKQIAAQGHEISSIIPATTTSDQHKHHELWHHYKNSHELQQRLGNDLELHVHTNRSVYTEGAATNRLGRYRAYFAV